MIQSKTLEALNYFLDEDIHSHKDNIAEDNNSKELNVYYKGYIDGLEYAKHLINQNWKHDEGNIIERIKYK